MPSINHLPTASGLYQPALPGQLAIDNSPEVLTTIYDDDINIAVWKRNLSLELKLAVDVLINTNPNLQASMTLTPANALEHMMDLLGQTEHEKLLAQDIAILVDMFCCLFELERVGLRVAVLSNAMCPRFHVDRVPCRLITTYQGEATQWLPNRTADRSKLGHGSRGLPDHDSGLYSQATGIHQLNEGDVALLKGESWEGNEGAGLIHRSPSINEPRLLLTLDFSA